MCSGVRKREDFTSQELVAELNQILDLLGNEDLHALPAESVGDDIKALLRVGNRVDGESSRRMQRFDKGQGYATSGALTAQAWLRWQCNLTGGAVSQRVEV